MSETASVQLTPTEPQTRLHPGENLINCNEQGAALAQPGSPKGCAIDNCDEKPCLCSIYNTKCNASIVDVLPDSGLELHSVVDKNEKPLSHKTVRLHECRRMSTVAPSMIDAGESGFGPIWQPTNIPWLPSNRQKIDEKPCITTAATDIEENNKVSTMEEGSVVREPEHAVQMGTTKPYLSNWQPWHGLTEDSRTTDYGWKPVQNGKG